MKITDKASFSNKSPARNKSNRLSSFAHAGLGQQLKRRILFGGGFDETAFDPLDISATATLELWLDASQITGMSDGDDFTQTTGNCEWSDQSGNSVAISSPGPQGGVASYQTNIINGLPAILFQPPHGLFTAGEQVYANLSMDTFKAADYTVFIVVQPIDVTSAPTDSGQHIFGMYSEDDWTESSMLAAGNCLSMGILDSDAKFITQGKNPVNDRVTSASAFVNDKPQILTAAYDYSETTMWSWLDGGVGFGTGNSPKQTNWDGDTGVLSLGPFIGGLQGGRGSTKCDYDGYVAEIIVYSTLLSERELNFVKHYLADKYNISVPSRSRY